MSSGYSATSLVKKLGICAAMRAAFVNPPRHYPELLGELPRGRFVRRIEDRT